MPVVGGLTTYEQGAVLFVLHGRLPTESRETCNFNMKYSFYRKNIRCKHHANYFFVLWQIIAESILAIFSFLSAVLLKRL